MFVCVFSRKKLNCHDRWIREWAIERDWEIWRDRKEKHKHLVIIIMMEWVRDWRSVHERWLVSFKMMINALAQNQTSRGGGWKSLDRGVFWQCSSEGNSSCRTFQLFPLPYIWDTRGWLCCTKDCTWVKQADVRHCSNCWPVGLTLSITKLFPIVHEFC